MYLQEVLEVAIGLVFMWLVVSVAAMTLQEWISNILQWRAKDLENNISILLNQTDFAKEIYRHPLIASLYSPPKNPKKSPRLPSYIPANKFAAALFDLIVKAGSNESPIKAFTNEIDRQLQALHDPDQQKMVKEDWETILETGKQVAKSGAGQNAVDSLKVEIKDFGVRHPELKDSLEGILLPQIDRYYKDFLSKQIIDETNSDLLMRQFHLGLKSLSMVGEKDFGKGNRSKLKEAIEAILSTAQVSLEKGEAVVSKARKEFENWFNDSMDRLSGAYKRKAQVVSFIIGTTLALLLNVDSINLATSLWREPILRQAIVAQAQDYIVSNQQAPLTNTDTSGTVDNPIQNVQKLQADLGAINIPLGWFSQPIPQQSAVSCKLNAITESNEAGNLINIYGIQVGKVCYPLINSPVMSADYWLAWLIKILGMLITGAAAAQGAPFWFDILKKLVNVRSAGIKPEEKNPKPVG